MRRNDTNSIPSVRSLWLSSYSAVYPGEWCACVSMFDIQWISHRNVTGPKNKERKKKKNPEEEWKKGKKELEVTEIFSVLFCSWYLLSEVTYSYGNIQNKTWNTVSYTHAFDSFLVEFSLCKIMDERIYERYNVKTKNALFALHSNEDHSSHGPTPQRLPLGKYIGTYLDGRDDQLFQFVG